MKLTFPFRLMLYLTMIASSMAVASAEEKPIYLYLMIFACLVHAAAVWNRADFRISRMPAAALSIFAIGYAVYDLKTSEFLLFAAAHFLVLMQIIKLFCLQHKRDLKELLLMSLVLMGVSAVMTFSIAFAPAFVLYVTCAIVTQVLFTIRQDAEAGGIEPRLPRSLTGVIAFLTVACLGGALFVFLSFPRFGDQFATPIMISARGLTGFTQSIHLRGNGNLQSNSQIVFRASLDGPVADMVTRQDLLWRGTAIEYFDGANWTKTPPNVQVTTRACALPFTNVQDSDQTLVQHIEQETSVSRMLFGVWHIDAASTPGHSNFSMDRDPYRDSYRLTNRHLPGLVQYTIESQFPPNSAELASATGRMHERIRQADTQLPEGVYEKFAPLSKEIAPSSLYPTTVEKVEAIERHLEQNYIYTTELPGMVEDPLGKFVFETKRGHCEMFASAMAVLLRCQGIPARVVSGFFGGQWNEFLDTYVIRQQDAHAWVEVYYTLPDGRGLWVPYNPTPMSANLYAGERSIFAYMARMMDYLRVKWTAQVIYFSSEQQSSLAKYLRYGMLRGMGWLHSLSMPQTSRLWPMVLWVLRWILTLAVIGSGLYLLRRLLGLRFSLHLNKASRSRTKFYRELLRFLARHGHKRKPWQTPLEFAHAVVNAEGPDWAPVTAITRLFCDVRYGSAPPEAEQQARKMLEELRKLR